MGSVHTGVCVQKESFANATHSHKIYWESERVKESTHTKAPAL